MDRKRNFSVRSLGLLVAAFALAPAWADAQTAPAAPTFTKDIAPILQRSCQSCHRVGQMAPMSLVTYQEVRPWTRSIKSRVAAREMPPWHVDKTIGIQQFKDDPSLSDQEIATIVKWADSGAPQGNLSDMPPPRQFADGNSWQIGEPDLIIKFPKYRVPAEGPDWYGDLYADIPIDEDRYIKAIQTRSATQASHRVVHHALSYSQDAPSENATMPVDGGQFLVEYAQGKNAEVYPEGSGVLLQKGQKARLSYHLHAIGEEMKNIEVELGIYLYPKGVVPERRTVLRMFDVSRGSELDIPPNQTAMTQNFYVMQAPARLENFQPHMHMRGKSLSLEAIYPDGRKEILSAVNNFQWNWHVNYIYGDNAAPLLPKGTTLVFTAWHDNTANNPNNPDPRQWVGWGDRTVDEMAHVWVDVTYLEQADFDRQVAARKAAAKK